MNNEDMASKLLDIVEEIYCRETTNNCIKFVNKGYIELCDEAINLLEQLKGE